MASRDPARSALDLAAHPAFARPWRVDDHEHRSAMDAATQHLAAPFAALTAWAADSSPWLDQRRDLSAHTCSLRASR